MTYSIPTTEPTYFYAKHTLQWTKELSDYPASFWTLKYYFVHTSSANNFSITASASGNTHVVLVSASSSNYTAGTYRWYAEVTLTATPTEKYVVDWLTGECEVKADPSGASVVRTLTHAQTCLTNIKSVLEGTASTDAQSYSIGGRSLSRYSTKELLDLKSYYEAEVAKEQRAESLAQGKQPSNRIKVNLY